MYKVAAVEGGIFDKNTIFVFSNDYYQLRKCVENKKAQGIKDIKLDLHNFDHISESFTSLMETIQKVSLETGVALSCDRR